ncbi:PGBD2 isoform 2, partial [Pongo abelii]
MEGRPRCSERSRAGRCAAATPDANAGAALRFGAAHGPVRARESASGVGQVLRLCEQRQLRLPGSSWLQHPDNNELDASDRFAKVRPLIIRMNCNFQKHAPLEEFYSFGESM